jgi:hypothetical protein
VLQKDLTEWFTKETGHEINQSLISKILSKNYDYLDTIDKQKDKQVLQGKKKNSVRDWPDLEAVLYKWQQRIELKKAIITGDILKEKARQLWDALSQYYNIE